MGCGYFLGLLLVYYLIGVALYILGGPWALVAAIIFIPIMMAFKL
jgi:hypothetical protein